MGVMIFLSDIMIPLLIFGIVGYGILNRQNIYEEFIDGAKDGFQTVIGIMPTLIGLMVAVGILRASGFLECFSGLLGRGIGWLGFPPEHGSFGADMQVASVNDGPVTILFDTDNM